MIEKYWKIIPTWLRAILIGFILLMPIVTVIQSLVFKNVVSLPELPWSTLITFILLGFYWQFISGAKYPFGKSLFRSRYAAIKTTKHIKFSSYWKIGISLLMFVFAVTSIGFAFFGPENTVQLEAIREIGKAPRLTAIFLYLALAVTAGIIEETVFRGYIQHMMHEQYGMLISFLSVALGFTLIHFLPPALYLPYFLVSLAFSWVTYATGSIIIGIIVHATFDFVAFLLVYFDTVYVSPSHLSDSIPLNSLITIITILILWYEGTKLQPKSRINKVT